MGVCGYGFGCAGVDGLFGSVVRGGKWALRFDIVKNKNKKKTTASRVVGAVESCRF